MASDEASTEAASYMVCNTETIGYAEKRERQELAVADKKDVLAALHGSGKSMFLPLPYPQITCGIMTNSDNLLLNIHEYHHVRHNIQYNIPEGHRKVSTVPRLPFSPNSRAAASETTPLPRCIYLIVKKGTSFSEF